MSQKQLAHLAGSNHAHTRLRQWHAEVVRSLHHRKLDCRGGDGDGTLRNLRLSTDKLARHHRRVEQPAQHLARRPGRPPRLVICRRDGVRVARLDLRKNLPLADDEGVEARRDAEQVHSGLLVLQHEQVGPQLRRLQPRVGAQKVEYIPRGREQIRRHNVDLEPVAGGEDGRLLDGVVGGQRGGRLVPVLLLDRQLLTHLHRRSLVRESNHERKAVDLALAQLLAERRTGSLGGHGSLGRRTRLLHFR
mmetsp:Transcript_9409/g.31235  ORF Transcript_9409/g.31235 Transcript_9409/m.31235 type:complete len:248 (-) Transcript_9409:218-961(-)